MSSAPVDAPPPAAAAPPRTFGRRASDRRRVPYLLLLVMVLAFLVFRHFLLDIAVAAPLAIFLAPLYRRLTVGLGGRASLAAALVTLLLATLILIPVVASTAVLGRQAVSFFEWLRPSLDPERLHTVWLETLPRRLPWLASWVTFDDRSYARFVSEGLDQLSAAVNRLVQRTLAGITGAVLDLVLFLMMMYFFLRDGPALRAELHVISPLSQEHEEHILDHLTRTVRGVLQAMLLVPLAQGAAALLGFLIFGVPSPLLWSVFVTLAAFVPILGSPLGWVPACVYLFARGSSWQWIGMLVYGVGVISMIDNIIKPMILRESARIHPLLAFLAILGGVFSFGPLGFLVGPVILSLVLSAIRIYRLDVLEVSPGPARHVEGSSV